MKVNLIRAILGIAVLGFIWSLMLMLESNLGDIPKTEEWAQIKKAVLGALISAVVAMVLLLIPKGRPETEGKPEPIDPPPVSAQDDCTERLAAASRELEEWYGYRHKMDAYLEKKDALEAFLNTRTATLRLSMVFIVVLAVAVGIAGVFATRYFDYVPLSLQGIDEGTKFISNLGVLSLAYLVTGIGIGAALVWMKAKTTLTHAWRCAAIVALVLNLGSQFVTMSNMVSTIWMQDVNLFGISGVPRIAWFLLFRLIVTPSICVLASVCTFRLLDGISKRRAAAAAI